MVVFDLDAPTTTPLEKANQLLHQRIDLGTRDGMRIAGTVEVGDCEIEAS